uniref:Uncharacterized protein n=1 Tax=Panagrolaimus sp. PS1159 TaxID=55785 RepID=A0AC35GD10_9BILA
MDILVEETVDENLQEIISPIDALVDEQGSALFDLCDMNKKGYIVKEDLKQLDGLIPNFSPNDLEQQLYCEVDNKNNFMINRDNFVRVIKPFLLKQNKSTLKQKKRQTKEVSKSMFRTISLDNDETKQQIAKPLSSETKPRMRLPKLSISLDEKLGSTDFINLRNPSSIPKELGNDGLYVSQESRPSIDSDDYESIPMNSPFYDRTFSIPDDNASAITSLKKRPEEQNEEIEKRNHNEIKEMLKKSRSSLEIKPKKLERPCNFGPTSLLEHPIVADDVKTPDRIFKIVFVGDSAVGKTCFLHRFCHNRFKPLFNATIGVDFTVKSIKLVDRLVAVQLWDTAGQERFRSITKQYFRKADSVILMYDVTSEQSFLNVRNWIESVRIGVGDCCVLCLVGNKVDLASNEVGRKVTYDDGKQIAQEFDMLFFETSAYTGLGINDCMKAVAIRLQQREDDQLEEALRLEMIIQNSKRSWCCV